MRLKSAIWIVLAGFATASPSRGQDLVNLYFELASMHAAQPPSVHIYPDTWVNVS